MRQISSKNMAGIVCRTLNHVDERLVDHGIRVAYIMLKMLEAEGNSDQKSIRDLCFLTMVHDVGAYKTEEINNMVQFDTGNVDVCIQSGEGGYISDLLETYRDK